MTTVGKAVEDRFRDQVAVVTGGANGIGKACCLRFAAEGAAVVVADLQADAAEATAAEIEANGGRATAVKVDATSREDNERMAATAVEAYGGLDILMTAAGISHASYVSGDTEAELKWIMSQAEIETPQRVIDYDVDEFRTVLEVNLIGTFIAIQAAAARMIDSGRGGSIVTVASIAAKDPDAGPIAYTASKAGVWMLTKKLARELAPADIRVNAIGPGYIQTNMTEFFDLVPEELSTDLYARIPMQRRGQPSEIASVASFLASGDSSYMTGEILHPDGGWFTE